MAGKLLIGEREKSDAYLTLLIEQQRCDNALAKKFVNAIWVSQNEDQVNHWIAN